MTQRSPVPGRWWAVPPLLFAAVVYWPITRNYFYIDDFLNLYHIANDRPFVYLLRENGGHVLLTRNALFYLTVQLFGPSPAPFYWSALLTHLLNVYLLFTVIARITGRNGLASFGAGLWGSSPLQEGTLGWYSVYGHAMVGTTLLLILAQAARMAEKKEPPSRPMRYLWGALALAGATSFGTGIALAMMLPFALYLLFPSLGLPRRRPPLLPLVILVPLLYVVLTRLFEYYAGAEAPVRTIAAGAFSALPASLTTGTRILSAGVARWLLGFYLPTTVGIGGWSVLLMLFTFAVAGAIWEAAPAQRRQLVACLLLALSCYGAIAIARSMLQSVPDSVVGALTRYHYAPTIPLTMLLCLMLARVGQHVRPQIRIALLVAWYAVALAGYVVAGPTIDHHDIERAEIEDILTAIRTAVAAQPSGSTVRIKNAPFRAFPLYSFVPGWAAVFTMFYPDNMVDGRRVEFVEANRHIREAHQHGRRIGLLLVAPQ